MSLLKVPIVSNPLDNMHYQVPNQSQLSPPQQTQQQVQQQQPVVQTTTYKQQQQPVVNGVMQPPTSQGSTSFCFFN